MTESTQGEAIDSEFISHFKRLFQNFEEQPEPTLAEVKGSIPKWVKGTLLRNGPGMFDIGPDRYNHWFDGMALMQRFYIENGQVWSNTKFLRSEAFKRNTSSNRIVVSEFGTMAHPDPCKSMFNRYFSYFFDKDMTDNALVNFVTAGDEVYAATETPVVSFVDPGNLDTIRRENAKNYVAINTTTAHPHTDEEGNIYNLGTTNTGYCVIKIPNPKTSGKPGITGSQIVANIPKAHRMNLSYFHSFGMSQNYTVLPEMSLLLNVPKLLAAMTRIFPISYGDSMEWHPEFKPNFRITDIRTGHQLPLSYISPVPFFIFHHINTFEEHGCIFVDDCVFDNADVLFSFDINNIGESLTPKPIVVHYFFQPHFRITDIRTGHQLPLSFVIHIYSALLHLSSH